MKPHMERVLAEKASLEAMRGRLAAFLKEHSSEISEAEFRLLFRQADAMEVYSGILGERLDAEGQ